jgi:hypothetical protein
MAFLFGSAQNAQMSYTSALIINAAPGEKERKKKGEIQLCL